VQDVARQLGVKPRTLQWWNWKLQNERAPEATEFLPVVAAERSALVPTGAVELEAKGVRIRVEVGTDVQYVAALVAAIRGAC